MQKLHIFYIVLIFALVVVLFYEFAPPIYDNLKRRKYCEGVHKYKAVEGIFLDGIIESLVESQDFSSYCREDFNVARTWFLNMTNHPTDLSENNEEYMDYMKERLILALTYSANCKDGCTLRTENDWLSATDHCEWEGVRCNPSKEMQEIWLDDYGLSGEFIMFGLKSLFTISLSFNNLSGTFIVAGKSENLGQILLGANKLTGFVGGNILTNLGNLWLASNEFKRTFFINEKNFPTSISTLSLSENQLTGIIGLEILTNLEYLDLKKTSLKFTSFKGLQILANLHVLLLEEIGFEGDFIISKENFPDTLTYFFLSGEKLTGFDGLQILTNLEKLRLGSNEFAGDFIINEETFPTSIKKLAFKGNKFKSFVGLQRLKNLEKFSFCGTDFVGDFVINEKNFPKSIKTLEIFQNKLMTGFVGGGNHTNLELLYLYENKFLEGDFIITAENFPDTLKLLSLYNNTGLKSIDADSDAVPKLEVLDLEGYMYRDNYDVKGPNPNRITVKEELCKRRPGRIVTPSSACADIFEE